MLYVCTGVRKHSCILYAVEFPDFSMICRYGYCSLYYSSYFSCMNIKEENYHGGP